MAIYLTDEQSDQAVDHEDLVTLARRVVAEERVPPDMEVSLLLVDVDTMASINERYMEKEGPTDVLAFPIDMPGESPPDSPAVLGDVLLCPAVAARQAASHGHVLQDELQMLTVHGILHLLGMDHADPEEERVMFGRTDELLALHRSPA